MKIFKALGAVCLAACQVDAKAVFAHFMIGNSGTYTVADFVYDMQLAQQAAIDGFSLNMANGESQNDHSIPLAFQAATQVPGFKLFFSFDYAGNGAWPAASVRNMIQSWSGHGSYFRHSTGQPLVSTFEGRENADDWHDIKAATGAFFIPDWSSIGAKKAVALSKGVADGLFNWGAWPDGTAPTNWDLDASYLIFLQQGGKPTYMAPVSPWFYTNMPGFDGKNWLWQGGTLWYQRWERLAALSVLGQDQWPNQPEYIQIISWNDYGESHYIGPLNDKAYLAFQKDKGNPPFNYALGHPHDGWRRMLSFMITTWKTGTAVVTQEVVTAWYRLTPGSACATGGTVGNNADQAQTETSPQELSPDRVYVAALLSRVGYARVTVGVQVFNIGEWESQPQSSATGGVGVYYGSVDTKGATGAVKVEIWESAQGTVGTLNGEPIKASYAWVGSATLSRSISPISPSTNLKQQQCIKGNGSKGQFNELCQYTCNLGYCPPGPCTCSTMGKNANLNTPTKNIIGYPLPGMDCTYLGLCAFACNHGFCPSGTCTADPSAKDKCIVPAPPPDPDDPNTSACTSGSGSGNLMGLCDFSCGRGYCPQGPCTCTGRGPKITPPAVISAAGLGASGMGLEYNGLCNFACSRGYCPATACEQFRDATYGGVFLQGTATATPCDTLDEKPLWMCGGLGCEVADNSLKSSKEQWDSVDGNGFLRYIIGWFGDYNDFNPNPYNFSSQPFDSILNGRFKNHPTEAIAFFFSQSLHNGFDGRDTSTNIDLPLYCAVLGPEGSNCASYNKYRCGTTPYPALDLMLKSWVNFHTFHDAWEISLVDAQVEISARISDIVNTFLAPHDDRAPEIFEKIFGFFSAIVGLGTAGSAALSLPGEAAGGIVGAFLDIFGSIAGTIEAKFPSPEDAVQSLNAATYTFLNSTRWAAEDVVRTLFDNSNYVVWSKAYDIFKDGVWLEPSKLSTGDMLLYLRAPLYAFCVVHTWQMTSPVVVIYEEGVKNGEPGSSYLMPHTNSTPVRFVVPAGGNEPNYTLWFVQVNECHYEPGYCVDGAVLPTAVEQLTEEGNMWGVAVKDLALSSFYAYIRGGKTNPYRLDEMGKGMNTSEYGPYAFSEGLQTPGLYSIPVCSSQEYEKNIAESTAGDWDTWPCH